MFRPLGEDVTELLDYVLGSFRVIRHVRPKLSCCSCETITQTPAPSLPIRRDRAGAGLLAHVLISKYCDHLLQPLVEKLGRHVMAGDRVHADETLVPMLEPGLGRSCPRFRLRSTWNGNAGLSP